jgi:RPA family protein
MMKRHPAQPLLVEDLNSAAVEELKGADGMVKRNYITPTGESVFRVLLSGVLMDRTEIGSGKTPMYRLRIADPTGGMTFTAGRYDPEVLPVVEDSECPAFVTLIGKVRTYTNRKGEEIITVKPESVTFCSSEERDFWLFTAVRDILARRWMMESRGPLPSNHIRPLDPEEPRGGEETDELVAGMVERTLKSLDRSFYSRSMEMARKFPISPSGSEEEADQELEDEVLEIIRSLDGGDGARWDDMVDLIEKKRLSRDIIENVISDLLDRGMLYEPVLGYLKPI